MIDIGNTCSKLGIFKNDELIESESFKNITIKTLKQFILKHTEIQNCIISSVSESKTEIIDFLNKSTIKTILLDQNTKLPIKNFYKSKNSLGYDRIAAASGANSLFPNTNILVIDAGTAITIDFVNAKNEFLGGNISPGIDMRFRALNYFTKKLPYLKKIDNITIIGETTNQAVINGVLNGTIFELNKYIEYYMKQFNDLKIVITGGDANFFEKKLKNPIFVISNLVLIGLNRILIENEV
ncbi:MAG: type III pantothenate kinase [Bacteroidales bacterium]|nr:type III pantothenate kinase [Bacteroidales bacterium]